MTWLRGLAMLHEEEIRAAIVQLAKPLAERGGSGLLQADHYIIDGLAWALLGARPQHGKLRSLRALQQFLENTCGIPCHLVKVGSHHEICWDDAWMKAHGL